MDVLKALLAEGVNADIQNDKGYTPMHSSVMNQGEEALKVLIDHKVDAHLNYPIKPHC